MVPKMCLCLAVLRRLERHSTAAAPPPCYSPPPSAAAPVGASIGATRLRLSEHVWIDRLADCRRCALVVLDRRALES